MGLKDIGKWKMPFTQGGYNPWGSVSGETEDKKIKGAEQNIGDIRKQGRTEEEGYLGQLDTQDEALKGQLGSQWSTYKDARDQDINKYADSRKQAGEDIRGYMDDASKQYTGTIQPRLQGLMEDAEKNNKSAMTLEQSMDPNNSVQLATRKRYEDQAQGEGRQGLADVGVMQALGAQNFGTQLTASGAPMTGGQMSALMGQNMSQAGAAMANTQRRIQGLRDQGIERGYSESDKAYGRGQDANARYRQSIGDVESAGGRNREELGGYTKQNLGLAREKYDIGTGQAKENMTGEGALSGLSHQLGTAGTNRRLASSQKNTAGMVEDQNSRIKGFQGSKEQKAKGLSGLFSAGGGMLGNMFGGKGNGGGGGGSGKGGGGGGSGDSEPVDEEGIDAGADDSGNIPDDYEGGNVNPASNDNSQPYMDTDGGGWTLTGEPGGYQSQNPYRQQQQAYRPRRYAR